MSNTLSVVSKPNVHKTYGERLSVGAKKGEIALGAVIYYAQRTSDVDDLNSLWNSVKPIEQ